MYSTDGPEIADVMKNLDLVNEFAAKSDGFIWCLQDDSGHATSIQAYVDQHVGQHAGMEVGRPALTIYI